MDLTTPVTAWNAHYTLLCREHRLKDMGDAAYVELITGELLGICNDDPALARAVYDHPNNQGGWAVDGVRDALG